MTHSSLAGDIGTVPAFMLVWMAGGEGERDLGFQKKLSDYFTLRVDWSDSIAGARAVVVLCDEKECYERAQKNGVLLVGKNYLVRPEVMPLLKLSSRALSAAKA